MSTPPKVIFLAAYLQPFLINGISALIRNYNARVLLVCWGVSADAPAKADDIEGLKLRIKGETDNRQLEKEILGFGASVAYAPGWMDKDFLRWMGRLKKNGVQTVMGMDAQWTGSLKQRLHCMAARLYLNSAYTHAWVPGPLQYEYARRLGFNPRNILDRLLCPDAAVFRLAAEARRLAGEVYPKSFLYFGRLVPHKFENLLTAFSSLSVEELVGWKMIVVGNGPLGNDSRMNSDNIEYHSFLSQGELGTFIARSGVFCLTSHNEPWGTAILEAGAAGMPMLVSHQCGAAYTAVIDNYNGHICDGASVSDIKDGLLKFVTTTDQDLWKMGKRSQKLAAQYDSDVWAATLMTLYEH